MSNRAATILAVAAVISSLCIYATFAQDPPRAPQREDGAIVVGPPPIRLQQYSNGNRPGGTGFHSRGGDAPETWPPAAYHAREPMLLDFEI